MRVVVSRLKDRPHSHRDVRFEIDNGGESDYSALRVAQLKMVADS
jgi:hypothetical protein